MKLAACRPHANFLWPHGKAANLTWCLDGAGTEAVPAPSLVGAGCKVQVAS